MSHRTRQCFSSTSFVPCDGELVCFVPSVSRSLLCSVVVFCRCSPSRLCASRHRRCDRPRYLACPWRRVLAPAACHLEAVWAVVVGLLFPPDRRSSSFNQSCVTFRSINKSQVRPQVLPCLLVGSVTIDTRLEDDTHAPH